MPIKDFYESRYIKIAQTMAAIDRIAGKLVETFAPLADFAGIAERVTAYARAAKLESETMKTDPAIFNVWPEFVATGDELFHFAVGGAAQPANSWEQLGLDLIREGKKIIEWVAFARVPMPKTTCNFLDRCDAFAAGEAQPAEAP